MPERNRTASERLARIVAALPDTASVTLPVAELRAWLDEAGHDDGPAPASAAASWRVLLWTVPAETRIGVPELCEALGRSRDWIYRQTGARASTRMPHRRLGGELEFLAGEVRAWLREVEDVVVRGPSDTPTLRVAR